MSKSSVPNPLLRYSAERLLFEANPKGTPYFRDTHFNKMIFLTYEGLKEQGIDIKLPYSWYKHGTLIHRNTFYSSVGHPVDYYISKSKNNSTRKISNLPKFQFESDIRDTIDDVIIKVVSKYKTNSRYFKKGYIDQLLDDDYSYAPYEYQRIFKRGFEKYLIDFKTPALKKIRRHSSFTSDDVELINTYLDELLCVFPDDFDNLRDSYFDWDDTIRMYLDCDQDLFLKNVEYFWEIFSKHLRIYHSENISQLLIIKWESKLNTEEYPSFENHLCNERKRLLEVWDSNINLNENTTNIVKKVNKIAFEGAVEGK